MKDPITDLAVMTAMIITKKSEGEISLEMIEKKEGEVSQKARIGMKNLIEDLVSLKALIEEKRINIKIIKKIMIKKRKKIKKKDSTDDIKEKKKNDMEEEEDLLQPMDDTLRAEAEKAGCPISFGTTKGKHVDGADLSYAKIKTKRQFRQYMNRFNKLMDEPGLKKPGQ